MNGGSRVWSLPRQDSDGTWRRRDDGALPSGTEELDCAARRSQYLSAKILLRTSPSLTGPWTDGEVIYQIPELQKDSTGYDPDTFCYAGKEHPEFEGKDEVVFTYVCNTLKPQKLAKKLNIYFPKVVRMKMPITGSKSPDTVLQP